MGIYNCADTLPDAIDSILSQTYDDWELIMCDDCSTDETYAVAEKYAESNPEKIILIRNEKNMRLAYTLNHCLQYANGEYIARMDTDDVALPTRFEKQVSFLNSNSEYDVVGGWASVYDGECIKEVRKTKEKPCKNDLLLGCPFIHPTIMMRKSAYDALNGYTVSSRTVRGQDLDLWFRFFNAGYKGYNLQESVLIYHESLSDYKKRTLKTASMYSRTMFWGIKLLKFSPINYIYALKPLISAVIPNKLMYFYHNK